MVGVDFVVRAKLTVDHIHEARAAFTLASSIIIAVTPRAELWSCAMNASAEDWLFNKGKLLGEHVLVLGVLDANRVLLMAREFLELAIRAFVELLLRNALMLSILVYKDRRLQPRCLLGRWEETVSADIGEGGNTY
jgi:hypothetical protein